MFTSYCSKFLSIKLCGMVNEYYRLKMNEFGWIESRGKDILEYGEGKPKMWIFYSQGILRE